MMSSYESDSSISIDSNVSIDEEGKAIMLIQNDYDDVTRVCALMIRHHINTHDAKKTGKPFVLGLPTGKTPIGVYERLIKFYEEGTLSFKNVVTFNMDEYYGLDKTHPQSYHMFMHTKFFDYIDIPKENINILDGTKDWKIECQQYEDKINSYGGIDLFLGGIGVDGHIAFNNPNTPINSVTRLVDLSQTTIDSNSCNFSSIEEMPKQALTVGIKTIMDSKKIILIASGEKKSVAVSALLYFVGDFQEDYKPRKDEVGPLYYPCTVVNRKEYRDKSIVIMDHEATNGIHYLQAIGTYEEGRYININGELDLSFENQLDIIKPSDKILITSPHPDDDVLGMGGTMQLLRKQINKPDNINIVYMTNGIGGLYEHDKEESLRIKEAQNAVSRLKYKHEQVIDGTLPFYNDSNRKTSIKDVEKMKELIDKLKPDHLFVCCDADPNGTHIKCLNILKSLKIDIPHIWLYKSVWEEWTGDETHEFYFDYSKQENKIDAIMQHKSQQNFKVNDGNITGLKGIIENYKQSDIMINMFSEKFKLMTAQQFYEDGLLDI